MNASVALHRVFWPEGQLKAHEVRIQNVGATSTARNKQEKLDKMVLSRNRTCQGNRRRASMTSPSGSP